MVILLAIACTFITPAEQAERRDQDGDGFISTQWGGSDCDDTNPLISPDQSESCNGVDDDCDGQIDVLESGGLTRFVDLDADGFGADQVQVCEGAPDVAEQGGDCDDSDAQINPAATETCAPGDEDCDGLVNEEDPSLDPGSALQGWLDQDGDGFGQTGEAQLSCDSSAPLVDTDGDCDDSDAFINPGMEEDCQTQVDEDCDGYGECVQWELVGPISEAPVGTALASVDINQDGKDDLIFGSADEDLVGALWGPAQSAESSLSESYVGPSGIGWALDAAPKWRNGKPVILAGGQGEAVLMVDKADGASLRMSGPSEDGFGELVQLLSGADPLLAVAATGASGGELTVFLFDGQQSGKLESSAAQGSLKLLGSDQGLPSSMEGLDHDGDGQEELALVLGLGGSKPHSVLLLEPWSGVLRSDDADVTLGDGKDAPSALASGDFDGDGHDDLALGNPYSSGERGEVLVFFGPIPDSKLNDADLSISGPSSSAEFGTVMARTQQTGAERLVVGDNQGSVWILDIQAQGVEVSMDADLLFGGVTPECIASGDLDGDGLEDLIFGLPQAEKGQGQVRIFSGLILP